MKMTVQKKTLASLCIIALIAGAGITYALNPFISNISWTFTPTDKTFTVSNTEHKDPASISYGEIIGETTKIETYTVTNNGNVPITVTALATATEATATFDKTTADIPVGNSATFTLTLVITGAGSCTVTFTAT